MVFCSKFLFCSFRCSLLACFYFFSCLQTEAPRSLAVLLASGLARQASLASWRWIVFVGLAPWDFLEKGEGGSRRGKTGNERLVDVHSAVGSRRCIYSNIQQHAGISSLLVFTNDLVWFDLGGFLTLDVFTSFFAAFWPFVLSYFFFPILRLRSLISADLVPQGAGFQQTSIAASALSEREQC